MRRGQTCSWRCGRIALPTDNSPAREASPCTCRGDLTGDDLILCQITSQAHRDTYSILLESNDFRSGKLSVTSFIRPNRLFTVEQSVILSTAGHVHTIKLDETLAKLQQLFS
jgi:mRNA interferase MazF